MAAIKTGKFSNSSSSKSSSSSSKSSSSPQKASVTVKTPSKVTLAPSTKNTMYSGGGGSSGGGSNTVPLYNKEAIQSNAAQLQRELKLTPSQALNMALTGTSSNSPIAGGTRYDPVLKKNVAVTGTQIRNMQTAEKALRGLGYTVQDARALSYNFKDNNAISALNQNVKLRTSPTVQVPTYTYSKSSTIPTNQYVSTGEIPTGKYTQQYDTQATPKTEIYTPMEQAPEGSANVFTALPVQQKADYQVGAGSTVVGEEDKTPQYRGSFNYL